MSRRQHRRTALSLLMAATVAACGGTAADIADTADGAPAATVSPTGPARAPATAAADTTTEPSTAAANAPALAFTGVDLDGVPVAGESFAGGDVVLWMWAPW